MNVLITGVASGIGKATADAFLARGHKVYGIDVCPVPSQEHLRSFRTDITKEEALLALRETLQKENVVLDAILNVAGIHAMTSLVEGDWPKMKKLMDINVSGAMLVNRVFHPCLKEKGRIIVVTSEVATLDPLPFNGLYSVTKTALESYAQALRQELNLLGQKVITVRPGAVETPLCSGSVEDTKLLAENTRLYEHHARKFSSIAAKFMGRPIAPERLAALLYKAVTKKHPHLSYKKHRNPGLVLLNLLPKRLQCTIVKLLLK